MKLVCYCVSDHTPEIRPAPAQRQWMDDTPHSFAYRCLPLNIANMHGWEILNPAPFEAYWNGGQFNDAIKIKSTAPQGLVPLSHFGSGILTFHIHGLFRTEPDYNMYVTGPVNHPKDGIYPLTGVVETDWLAFTFTMNWKFTRPNARVRFEKGEPICHIFPVARGQVEQVEPEFRNIKEDPELFEQYQNWSQGREKFNKDLGVQGSDAQKQKWQKNYYRGKKIDGSDGVPSHQTKLSLKPFKDERKSAGKAKPASRAEKKKKNPARAK